MNLLPGLDLLRDGDLARASIPGTGWLALASYSLYLSHKAVFH